MRPSPRALVLTAALAAPWLVVACELTPQVAPSSTSSTSGTGGATSSTAGTGGATTSTGGHGGATTTSSSSTTATTSSSVGSGGQAGTGGQTTSSSGSASSSSGVATADAGDGSTPVVCDTTVTKYAVDPSPHIPVCFPIQYSTNPPTSGPHYPIWAAFQTYTTPVPQGFYVHDLEHGAVVITYNCPGGCDAELAQLATFLDTRPTDPLCVAPVRFRYVVTPDPHLDARFAASAWGWALKSNCFDLSLLGPFMDAHYGNGPEDFCNQGVDVTAPDAGTPADCGEAVADAGGQ